jgi:nucleoid-associated protein YgaU
MNTPTPRPDGATVHIVQSGDTLSGIAMMYNKTVDQIRELNATSLGANNLIQPGQEIVIDLPSTTPTPTPLPAPPTAEPTAAAVSENPEQPENTGGAAICVLAYHDRNRNLYRDDPTTEEVIPNVEFVVANPSGAVAQHISDNSPDPHCFTGLESGAYRVLMKPPAGYEVSGQAEWPVAVTEGASLDVQFGAIQVEGAETDPEIEENVDPTTENEEEEENPPNTSRTSRAIATLSKIGGIVVLLLAGAIAVFFAFNRQRMF